MRVKPKPNLFRGYFTPSVCQLFSLGLQSSHPLQDGFDGPSQRNIVVRSLSSDGKKR
jgi:hypothetical protein